MTVDHFARSDAKFDTENLALHEHKCITKFWFMFDQLDNIDLPWALTTKARI